MTEIKKDIAQNKKWNSFKKFACNFISLTCFPQKLPKLERCMPVLQKPDLLLALNNLVIIDTFNADSKYTFHF